jgi:hypothetical protein
VHKNDNKNNHNDNNNKYSYQTLKEIAYWNNDRLQTIRNSDVGINLTPTAGTERNYAAEESPIVTCKQPFNRHSRHEGEIYEVLQYFLFLGGKL